MPDWAAAPAKDLQALRLNYAKAPAFQEVFLRLEAVLSQPWERLLDVNVAAIETICELLGFTRDIRFSSQLDIQGERTERLIAICRALGADRYLTGDAAKSYLREELFASNGIELEYHRYRHPVYQQQHGPFVPYLSVVDLLMNHGRDSLKILADQDAFVGENPR